MATVTRQNANTAFRTQANAFATPAQAIPRPQRPPSTRPTPTQAPVARPRHREQSAWMLMMILVAAISVLCGVAYLWGQASLTSEGYRHSKLQKMLVQERAMEQQWRHEQAAQTTPASIEQKAKDQGMVKVTDGDAVTAGVPTPLSAEGGNGKRETETRSSVRL